MTVFYWIRDDGACGVHNQEIENGNYLKISKKASIFLFVIGNVIMISVFHSKEELHSGSALVTLSACASACSV